MGWLGKLLLNVAGTIFLALGVAGIFLPLLPATPFLLLASACYLRGSERLHALVVTHPILGPYIKAFRDERAMPRRAKIVAIAMLWASMTVSILVVDPLWLRILLGSIAVSVTVVILCIRTLEDRESGVRNQESGRDSDPES
jgi:uncharacterized membrane protein YbaN (DUF454 family)